MSAGTLLRIGVVGQVNAGKSSVHESLLRYREATAVSATPGWTRQVRSMTLSIEHDGRAEPIAEVLDFPGFQRAEALEQIVSGISSTPERLDDESSHALLERLRQDGGFLHEELVIEQARACDVLLLVVDTREPPGAAFRTELAVLRRLVGGAPIVLLNMTEHPASRAPAWREAVRAAGGDEPIAFDAWHLAWAHELSLWERIAQRVANEPSRSAAAQSVIADRARRREAAERAVAIEIADMVIDAAAARRPVSDADDKRERDDAARELMERARRREQTCFDAILSRLGFRRGDAVLEVLGASADAALADPWSAREVARLMPGLVKGLATGAVIGGGVGAATGFVLDLATLFTTIGAATVFGAKLGAAAGALAGGAYAIRDKLVDLPRIGRRDARLSRDAIELLGVRQLELALGLLGRGHAALSDSPTRAGSGRRLGDEQRRSLHEAVALLLEHGTRPRWSTLNGPVNLDDQGRVNAQRLLERSLLEALQHKRAD